MHTGHSRAQELSIANTVLLQLADGQAWWLYSARSTGRDERGLSKFVWCCSGTAGGAGAGLVSWPSWPQPCRQTLFLAREHRGERVEPTLIGRVCLTTGLGVNPAASARDGPVVLRSAACRDSRVGRLLPKSPLLRPLDLRARRPSFPSRRSTLCIGRWKHSQIRTGGEGPLPAMPVGLMLVVEGPSSPSSIPHGAPRPRRLVSSARLGS